MCRKCKHYPQGLFVLFSFTGDLQVITDFKIILLVPICVLLILGAHP